MDVSLMEPNLTQQRAAIGLKTPAYPQKRAIWSKVISPTAGIANGYKPVHGARLAHQADARGVGVSGGWRAGKSLFAGMEGVTWLPFSQLIWIVAKDYDMTRQEFIYLAEAAISTGLANPNDVHISLNKYAPCTMRAITGCIVETRTLSDFRKLASKPPDLVIVCEPGMIDNLSQVMELLWGRVSEKRGCVILAGTSDEASEEWFELWSRWDSPNPEGGKSFSIPTWQNRYRFPEGRNEREFRIYEEMYGEEALLAHYGGIPASPRNLVLRGYWKPNVHIREGLEFDPTLPVEIAIDPNYSLGNRYCVDAIQWDIMTGKLFLVDEIAEEGKTHDEIKDIVRQRPWWKFVYGGTIDPFAGEAHVYGAPSPVHYWKPTPLRTNFRPRVHTTVQALKESFAIEGDGSPRLTVSDKATRFVWEAGRWRNERSGEPSKKGCDSLKAVGYWLVDRFHDERLDVEEDADNVVIGGRPREWTFDS